MSKSEHRIAITSFQIGFHTPGWEPKAKEDEITMWKQSQSQFVFDLHDSLFFFDFLVCLFVLSDFILLNK